MDINLFVKYFPTHTIDILVKGWCFFVQIEPIIQYITKNMNFLVKNPQIKLMRKLVKFPSFGFNETEATDFIEFKTTHTWRYLLT